MLLHPLHRGDVLIPAPPEAHLSVDLRLLEGAEVDVVRRPAALDPVSLEEGELLLELSLRLLLIPDELGLFAL